MILGSEGEDGRDAVRPLSVKVIVSEVDRLVVHCGQMGGDVTVCGVLGDD